MDLLKGQLTSFYMKYAPGNNNIDVICKKYWSDPAPLWVKLGERYGRHSVKEYQEGQYDITSDTFNALLCLNDRHLLPPVPSATVFDNINKCRHLLPPDHPDWIEGDGASKRPKSVENEAAKRKEKPLYVSPLSTIADDCKDGPFSVLHRLLSTKARVKVLIRYIGGVRGHCTGILKAYDHHMNLALIDVEEQYDCVISRGHGGGRGKKVEARCRHLNQLLIRGDNVVMVHEHRV